MPLCDVPEGIGCSERGDWAAQVVRTECRKRSSASPTGGTPIRKSSRTRSGGRVNWPGSCRCRRLLYLVRHSVQWATHAGRARKTPRSVPVASGVSGGFRLPRLRSRRDPRRPVLRPRAAVRWRPFSIADRWTSFFPTRREVHHIAQRHARLSGAQQPGAARLDQSFVHELATVGASADYLEGADSLDGRKLFDRLEPRPKPATSGRSRDRA